MIPSPNISIIDRAELISIAETAAAVMDSWHSETCRQDEGSDSAYAELYEAATRMQLGFPGIWLWAASLAVTVPAEVEALWREGKLEYIDCVHTIAQQFHNYITHPYRAHDLVGSVPDDILVSLWQAAVNDVREHAGAVQLEQGEMDQMIRELEEEVRNDAGYIVGVFTLDSEEDDVDKIVYDNFGGKPVVIRAVGSGLWRVDGDIRTDAPRPAIALRIARKHPTESRE